MLSTCATIASILTKYFPNAINKDNNLLQGSILTEIGYLTSLIEINLSELSVYAYMVLYSVLFLRSFSTLTKNIATEQF